MVLQWNSHNGPSLPRADNLSIMDTGCGTNWNYYGTSV